MEFKIARKGYDPKQVDDYLAQIKSESEEQIAKQKALICMLKDKIVMLDAKLKEYESKKDQIAKALICAQAKAEELENASKTRYEDEVRALRAFHLRWSAYYKKLISAYPLDAELEKAGEFNAKIDEIFSEDTSSDLQALEQFRREQEKITGIPAKREQAKEGEFDYNAALHPTEDLSQLLKDLGLQEE